MADIILGVLYWYLEWALPSLGMFSEAYIVFSSGQIGQFQNAMWPQCYKSYIDCDQEYILHLAGYIQICGIIAGMLFWGTLGDYTGRKLGSQIVISIMLSGCILLTFSPYATTAFGYFAYFNTAQTWYGFGVGGEYPMASSLAAERSESSEILRKRRGEQVILVFSGQGMGNLTNASVILVAMYIFGQTGPKLTSFEGSQKVLALTYGVGAFIVFSTTVYRWLFQKESQVYNKENDAVKGVHGVGYRKQLLSLQWFWSRQLVASGAWIANDFAFYGNKLQQNFFIGLLYPSAIPYIKQQWNVLNSCIALSGYWVAAATVDKTWYGRRTCQTVGFVCMFAFYLTIFLEWDNMNYPGNQPAGMTAFQALYYLSSFFNQFGPNATTWLVAGEIFPTNVRATNHGFAAAMGKVGAIIAALWISYITDSARVFLISAMFGIGGAIGTILFLPDTTNLDIVHIDTLGNYILEGKFHEYTGEAINPKHLSLFEIYVYGWHKNYIASDKIAGDSASSPLTKNEA